MDDRIVLLIEGGNMNSLQEILKQAQKDLYCPTCGRNFSLGEIHLRGLFDNTLLLQTICSNGHSPIIMIFIAPYKLKEQLKPIEMDDVLTFHAQIKSFNGDFQSLWKQRKR